MCGIIGMAGILTTNDDVLLKDMLFMDTVRGKHATGLVKVQGNCEVVSTIKAAYSAPFFLCLPEVVNFLNGFNKNTVVLGHNRHATKGSATEHGNAHPFTSGNITLVHNGSLTNHHSLTKGYHLVDSAAIAEAFEKEGAKEVLPKLEGAYSLVWIDEANNTLNFARNSERPMYIATSTTTKKIYWASEKGMLHWLLTREGTKKNFDEIKEVPVGKWIKYPITKTGIDLDTEEESFKVAEPVSSYYSNWKSKTTYYTRRNNVVVIDKSKEKTELESLRLLTEKDAPGEKVTIYSFGPTREDAYKKLTKNIVETLGRNDREIRKFITNAESEGTILDERVDIYISDFFPYKTSKDYGYIAGHMLSYPYSDVIIHGCSAEGYAKISEGLNKFGISAYIISIKKAENCEDFSDYTLFMNLSSVRASKEYVNIETTDGNEDNVIELSEHIDNNDEEEEVLLGHEGK